MSYTYSFEKLQVWHDARSLVSLIYTISETFPSPEKYGLTSQVRRAAVSIVSNIAEGSGRTSLKDQAHFYQLAFSSLIEVLNQLIIAGDLCFINEVTIINVRLHIEKVSNKLNSLRKNRLES